jgi:hypothetical protein
MTARTSIITRVARLADIHTDCPIAIAAASTERQIWRADRLAGLLNKRGNGGANVFGRASGAVDDRKT